MPKFAANLSLMFNEHAFLDRFQAAAAAGFEAVEFLFPYAFKASDIADRLAANHLQLVLHNLPAGDWEAGERGIACDPARVGEFRDGVELAIAYAQTLGVAQLHCLAGVVPSSISPERARDTFSNNLRHAAARLKPFGLTLLIEPINHFDIPGYFLTHTRQAASIIEQIGADNLFLQYDIYHMQRMEGDLCNTIQANLPLIKHMQLADNPGRGEPGTGEINYRHLFAMLDQIGYQGWIGCEYRPRARTLEGLAWRDELTQ
jgi:hydroxypyruvate isomerase